MQERSEAERRAIWPCLNVATWRKGRDISSPAIWATKISALFDDNNVAQMSRQIRSHTHSALNAGAKRRAMWPCLNVATWRRERSN